LILQTFLARRVRHPICPYALGHVVHLQRELTVFSKALLVDRLGVPVPMRDPHLMPGVGVCVLEIDPTARCVHPEQPRLVHASMARRGTA